MFLYLSCFLSSQISQRVFELMRNESSNDALLKEVEMRKDGAFKGNFEKEDVSSTSGVSGKGETTNHVVSEKDDTSKSVPFELYKRRTTVVVRRETFLNAVCKTLTEYKYVGPNQRADLILACR